MHLDALRTILPAHGEVFLRWRWDVDVTADIYPSPYRGVTRLEGPPVTPDTLFQAASISKPVSALAVMRLVQAGKLDLDADVNDYLKTWKVPRNDFSKEAKVTLRRLLSHTAGTTVHGFGGYEAGAAVPTLTQILDGQAPANNLPIRVDITPGKTLRYSGGVM